MIYDKLRKQRARGLSAMLQSDSDQG